METKSYKQDTEAAPDCAVTRVIGLPPSDEDLRPGLTVIVPAYNEAESITDTIRSRQSQTRPPQQSLVVDDCSTDATATVARAAGATVLRPPVNTASKAGAQTFALPYVKTELAMAVDADTTLAGDAVELLLEPFGDPAVAAASGASIAAASPGPRLPCRR